MELYQQAEMKSNINALDLSDKSIFVFGHCNASDEMCNYLAEQGYKVEAILDNNKNKINGKSCGIKIVEPEIILEYKNAVCLIANRYFETFKAQLRSINFEGDIVKVVDFDTFSEFSLSAETIKQKKERMIRGKFTHEIIRKQNPDAHLIICPHKALGDVYWSAAFLNQYCEKNAIKNITIIVVGDGCRDVAEMFGYKSIALGSKEMDEFVQAVIYNHEPNCIIAHHDRPYTDNIICFLDTHFLSFIDYYKCAVYGLHKDIEPAKPVKIADFEHKEMLIKDKSVIIAPFAKSIVNPPDTLWQKIISEYKDYKAFTVVNGTEKPLENTLPIYIPLNQMISAIEYAGHFIGLRSGLCDVVSSAKCNKTVLFPERFYSKTKWMVADFFAIPGWETIMF